MHRQVSLPAAYVSHTMPGRVRLRIPARRGDRAFFVQVEQALADETGITAVESNPATGSVLVYHDVGLEWVGEAARHRALFTLAERSPPAAAAGDRLAASGARADAAIAQVSGGSLSLATLSSVGFLSIGLVQLARGNVAPAALTLFWYAAQSLVLDRTLRMTSQLGTLFARQPPSNLA